MNKNFLLLKDSINYFKNKIDTVKFDYDKYLKTNELRIKNMHDSFFQYYRNNDLKVLKMDSLSHQMKLYRRENIYQISMGWVASAMLLFLSFIFANTK